MNKLYPTIATSFIALSAFALPTIQIDSVAQRWPWNNKVDITYTISGDGGQDVKSSQYCKVVFVATIGADTYTIDGASDLIAWADNGTHTVTWTNAPSGVSASDCQMAARLYRTDGYYMIIDLDTGAYAFDDLEDGDTPTATPTASNTRYNTPLYKSDRMVLRRIPRTSLADASYSSGYPTGDDTNYSTTNGRTNRVTDADYFIGVFAVTQSQYVKMGLANPSSRQDAYLNDVVGFRPVENMTYQVLRGGGYQGAIPANKGDSFFSLLNGKTGLAFDLPTALMREIACRAGSTGTWAWSGEASAGTSYCIDKTQTTPGLCRQVGLKASNVWGLFDMNGNVDEWCLHGATGAPSNMEDVTDIFTAPGTGGYVAIMGGNSYQDVSHTAYHASNIQAKQGWVAGAGAIGFRVAWVAK